MTLLERFADPSLITNMTTGEKMLASTYVTILGMGITFLALITLWIAITMLTRVIHGIENKQKQAAVVKTQPQAAAPVVEIVEETDDLELVAVITAAIAAATNQPMNQIVVKNIRRVSGNIPTWQQMGINNQLAKRM